MAKLFLKITVFPKNQKKTSEYDRLPQRCDPTARLLLLDKLSIKAIISNQDRNDQPVAFFVVPVLKGCLKITER